MKKALVFLALFATLSAHANEATDEIQDKAFQFIRKHKSAIAASDLIQVSLADTMGFFAYNLANNNGFVLVSKYNTNEIVGYSTTGHFAWNELPSNATNWLTNYQSGTKEEVAANTNQLKAVSVKTFVEPLCDANWWQYTRYNRNCPANTTEDTAVTGCVATAMGIIMKKWNYPPQGTGSIAYNDARYGSIDGNFEESVYDWQNMPNILTEESTPEQIDAVATLLSDCAKAIKSSFGNYKQGTEARVIITKNYPTENAEYAFPTYFGYEPSSIRGVIRSKYTTNKWKELIKKELSEGRPVIYNGTSKTATVGHCFVCDGYDKEGFFHFNWGWEGDLNGFFSIDYMVPYEGYDFSYNQEALIGIMPPSSYFDSTSAGVEALECPSVQIYPNPTNSQLHICLPEGQNNACLYLVNGEGITVKTIKDTDSTDVSNLSKGIYILTGTVNGKPFARKVEIK